MATNIDEIFLEAMRRIGGRRPAEIMPGIENVENADLVFDADRIIAEVKTLMMDTQSLKFAEKIQNMCERWSRAGLIPPPQGQRITIHSGTLPEPCRTELGRFLTSRIKRAVEKASSQIKSTKTALRMADGKGVLVLCNSGNRTLTPHLVKWGLGDALRQGQYSGVQSVVFMTFGAPVAYPEGGPLREIWAEMCKSDREPVSRDFLDRMKGAWFEKEAALRGEVLEVPSPDHAIFDQPTNLCLGGNISHG